MPKPLDDPTSDIRLASVTRTIVYHLFPGNMAHHVPNMVNFFIKNTDLIGSEAFRHRYLISGGDGDSIGRIQRQLLESENVEIFQGSVSTLFSKIKSISGSDILIVHSGFYK